MKFSVPERSPRLPAQVANAIMEEIREGRIKPGDRLPTEQFLVQHMGVSRNVVREAMAQLRAVGAVYSRQGIGTIVADPSASAGPSLQIPQLDSQALNQAYEIRAILETKAAGLAALRASPEQIAEISDTLHRMDDERWEASGVDADIDFHLAIARASGNVFIADTIKSLVVPMRQTVVTTLRRSGTLVGEINSITVREHTAIRDAIASGSAETARRAMAHHICNAAARLGYDLSMLDH